MSLKFELSDKPESYGHHFIVGLSGVTLDDYDKAILGKIKPAGVLLLRRNFDHGRNYSEWLALLKRLLKEVREYTERDDIIVSIDHEGGRVHRAPAPITRFPPALKYAKRSSEVAKAMAIELKSMGVNVSWSPLADIHSNQKNPIIGDRAFGTTAHEVAENAAIFLQSLSENEILGCAKHYPGHGDTLKDSHLELPSLELDLKTLRERELVPFRALTQMQVPFVMTAHILYPQIDSLWPATFSEKLLGDILRKEMAYEGIIISDDLDMQAVSNELKSEGAIGRAMIAGCDMFIVARNPDPSTDRPLVLTNYLYRCVKERIISEGRLHQSFSRIDQLFKDKLKQHPVEKLEEEIFESHAQLARDLA